MANVFNPSLESGIAFEQPIAQTSSVSAVSNIVSAFADSYSTPRAPTADDRFHSAVDGYASANELSSDVASWSPQHIRGFSTYAPQYGSRLTDLAETLGSTATVELTHGQAQAQALSEASIAFRASPIGRQAAAEAYSQNPDDAEARTRALQTAEMSHISRQARLADLQLTRETMEETSGIDRQIWENSTDDLRQLGNIATTGFMEAASRLREDPSASFTVGDIFNANGEGNEAIAQSLGAMINVQVTAENIGQVAEAIQGEIVQQVGQTLGVDAAVPDSVRNDAFSTLNATISMLNDSVDPTKILQWRESAVGLSVHEKLRGSGLLELYSVMEMFAGNEVATARFMDSWTHPDGRKIDEFTSDVVRRVFVNNDPVPNFDGSSVEQATSARQTFGVALQALNTQGMFTEADGTRMASSIDGVLSSHDRAGGPLGANVYRAITGSRGTSSMDPQLTEKAGVSLLADMTAEVDLATQLIGSENGVPNGQLVWDGNKFVSMSETVLNPISPTLSRTSLVPSTELGGAESAQLQQVISRLNEKVEILGLSSVFDTTAQSFTNEYTLSEEQNEKYDVDINNPPTNVAGYVNANMDQIMAIASSTMGMNENAQRAALSSFLSAGGVGIDPAETAWCAAFINSVLAQSGFDGTGQLNARSFENWGTAVETPAEGDVVVFWRESPESGKGHVGFFKGYDENGNILVLGGNQDDSVSVTSYSSSRLLGFRRAPGMPTGAVGTPDAPPTDMLATNVQSLFSDSGSFLPEGAGQIPELPTQPVVEGDTQASEPREASENTGGLKLGRGGESPEEYTNRLTPEASAEVRSLIEGLTATEDEKSVIMQYLDQFTIKPEGEGPR